MMRPVVVDRAEREGEPLNSSVSVRTCATDGNAKVTASATSKGWAIRKCMAWSLVSIEAV
jgi:hypothetical protein